VGRRQDGTAAIACASAHPCAASIKPFREAYPWIEDDIGAAMGKRRQRVVSGGRGDQIKQK